ncbi:MAG: hypothetical protein DRI57_01915 [Deltaproteobacteria bacterium]|nr:MAG: hypothetical protein DRI57_01915 [Deltaproteobacteria bacterium]
MKEESKLEAAPLRYAGVATLLRRPLVNDPSGVDIALIGVPYDGATENRPGTRHGPREIRNMSSFTRSIHHVTRVNPYELCNVADLGDVNFSNPFDMQQCFNDITDFYRKICAAGAVPLSVGGDHSVSFPILRAVAAERPVGMVHIDAHTDTHMTDRLKTKRAFLASAVLGIFQSQASISQTGVFPRTSHVTTANPASSQNVRSLSPSSDLFPIYTSCQPPPHKEVAAKGARARLAWLSSFH